MPFAIVSGVLDFSTLQKRFVFLLAQSNAKENEQSSNTFAIHHEWKAINDILAYTNWLESIGFHTPKKNVVKFRSAYMRVCMAMCTDVCETQDELSGRAFHVYLYAFVLSHAQIILTKISHLDFVVVTLSSLLSMFSIRIERRQNEDNKRATEQIKYENEEEKEGHKKKLNTDTFSPIVVLVFIFYFIFFLLIYWLLLMAYMEHRNDKRDRETE